MSQTLIPAALRRQVRERAGGRCEYCLLAEEDAYFAHEPDHAIALKHGGATAPTNLALACLDCNRFKGTDIASLDAHSGALTPLFNPRSDPWTSHFGPERGLIMPLTAVGRVTAVLLRLNLLSRVEVRDELHALGRWPAPVTSRRE